MIPRFFFPIFCGSFVLLLFSAGCGNPTPYQRMQGGGLLGLGDKEGYEEVQVDGNTFRVNFQGNGHTSKETVERYTLYRCAELTLERGYDYFVVVDESSATDISSSYNYGTESTDVSSSHSAQKTIKLFRGKKPEGNLAAYEAAEVLRYMRPHVISPY